MGPSLSLMTLLVREYDEAIDFYVEKLGFHLIEDTALSEGKRWVVVTSRAGGALLLAKAVGDRQTAAVGDQSGGRVFLFLETDDFARDHAAFRERGVNFRKSLGKSNTAPSRSSRISMETVAT